MERCGSHHNFSNKGEAFHTGLVNSSVLIKYIRLKLLILSSVGVRQCF